MIQNRLHKYIFLVVCCLITPLLLAMIIIIFTGDRIMGLQYFLIPSILLIHLLFSFTQLKAGIWKKVVFAFIASVLASGFCFVPLYFNIQLNLDMYGFWDLVVFFCLGSIGAWELLYQLNKKIF